MTRKHSLALAIITTVAGAVPMLRQDAAAQTPRAINIGGPPGDTAARQCATEAIVTAALAAFNSPAAVHVWSGTASIDAGSVTRGNFVVFRSSLSVEGTVAGDVIVLNGDMRVRSTGTVTGKITVLGGRLTIDAGAKVAGKPFACDERIALTRFAGNTVGRSPAGPSIGSLRSATTWTINDFTFKPHLGIGSYNRVEGLQPQVGASVFRPVGTTNGLFGEAYAIFRTARDPSGSRRPVGWYGELRYTVGGAIPWSVGVNGGPVLRSTIDQPYSPLESSISAFIFRRDYNDWYLNRGVKVFATANVTRELKLGASFEATHQTTVLAVDAFSLLRNTETWRPNPLIDDGRYRIATGRVTWDARDERDHPGLTWYVNAELRRVTSNDLTPVSVPSTIRDALPVKGYSATEGDFDLRASLRLDPEQRLNFRIAGGGYVTGNPLTIQDRRAIGGASPLPGYDFRAINCDRQRKVYASLPALCDRTMAVQAEYHRMLPIDLSTQIGGQVVGLRNPDFVILADMGSAWLAGDAPGRVPANRIQSLREWRSDVGVGITSGPLGLYLTKALADAFPIRLTLLLSPRF